MKNSPFRVLYREFLFRIVDLELLSSHAQGDSRTLLGQFASLLVFVSAILAVGAAVWASNTGNGRMPPLPRLISTWTMEHFLIATTMLAVGLFAVVSWESTFPDRRDVLVLCPLPVRARTLVLAKIAAVASALGLTLVSLHAAAGVAWPFALAQFDPAPVPALAYEPRLPPVRAADFPSVMDRDIAPMLRRLDVAAADGGAGIVVGVTEHGTRRIMAYGKARPDSIFEIGSISKTFTGLLLAQMAVHGTVDLRDRLRDFLPPGVAGRPVRLEITLLDLATHHSGLPRMPDNAGPPSERYTYTTYRLSALYDFMRRHGLERTSDTKYQYSNLGFAALGAALSYRAGTGYPELVRRDITGPLGMRDTAVSEQLGRLMQGYDGERRPTPRWDMDVFASAGGIRSTAGDMLAYLEAQLHPEGTPIRAALMEARRLRRSVAGDVSISLAWMYVPAARVYTHTGATGGFTSFACFDPRRNFGAVVLMNAAPAAFPFVTLLGEHVLQRLAGEPAFSLSPVSVPPAGPVRSFFAYWIAMLAAGAFVFCAVLGLQGFAAQLLPRRLFLRASAWLQLAFFCLFVSAYFLQKSPVSVMVEGRPSPGFRGFPRTGSWASTSS